MQRTFRWRFGLLAACAMTLLAMLPQADLWYARGGDWQGAYASTEGDEAAYAAYLAALIEGRPRLNDPYAGLDDSAETPLAESLFSIQFVPAYALALPARLLGLNAHTVFIILTPLVAFTASLALFWLLAPLAEDERLAAACVIFILCLGVSGTGMLLEFLGRRPYPVFLPFLRRYLPALPFPLLFLFCGCVWRALTAADARRMRVSYAVVAGVTFALLVYSYFYLWTTAAAWLACLALVWLVARKGADERRQALQVFLIIGALAALSLIPYALMLSRRAPTFDAVQALEFTRSPYLRGAPQYLGLVTLLLLAFGIRRRRLDAPHAAVLFAAAFALAPFLAFNQQVITGRSLQPSHYRMFTMNYLTLLAFALSVILLLRPRAGADVKARRILRPAVACAIILAYALCARDTMNLTRMFRPISVLRDRQLEVAWRIAEIGRAERVQGAARPVALVMNYMLSDNLPIVAPQAVLWSPHMLVNSGLTASQHKERIYQYLYYTGVAPTDFARHIAANRFLVYMIFAPARYLPYLSTNYVPVTDAEIDREQRAYADYVAAFTREEAARPALSYVITAPEHGRDLPQLDRWYERDAGERVGDYTIYRVRLRP